MADDKERIRQLEEQVREQEELLKKYGQGQCQSATSKGSKVKEETDCHPFQNQKRKSTFQHNTVTPPKQSRIFEKAPGTVDLGKKFEQLMCGLYALKLSTNNTVQDFEMSSNEKKCGLFDDIKINVNFKNGRKSTYMFQLKHKERETEKLTSKNFFPGFNSFNKQQQKSFPRFNSFNRQQKSPFDIEKYFNKISDIKNDSAVLILYTNASIDLPSTASSPSKIIVKCCLHLENEDILLNSKKGSSSVFEFCSAGKSIYFFTQQQNVHEVESELKKKLQQLLACDIYGVFTYYLNVWWSQNFVLTKHDFITKVTELALSPFVKTMSSKKVNEKTEILREAIMRFQLTIVQNDDETVENIWTFNEEQSFETCRQQFALTGDRGSFSVLSKISWILDKTPLILNVNQTNKTTIDSVLQFVKNDLGNKKLVLTGRINNGDFNEWNTFENLLDLKGTDLYQKIKNTFKVSLQGRPTISLNDLFGSEIPNFVTTQHLFEMSQTDFFIVGQPHEEVPELHVPRTVIEDDQFVAEGNIFDHFKNRVNLICAPPGMGKSRLFQALSNTCPSKSWSILISLISFNSFLATTKSTQSVISKFLGSSGWYKDLLSKEVKKILIKQKRVEIFLDGLDEVDSKYVDLVLTCVEHMKEEGLRVWISSREHLQEVLKVRPIKILELQQEEQRFYIHEKLKTNYTEEKIEDIINRVVKSVYVVNGQNLLGIPLQLHIVTEIFLQDANAFEELEKENMFVLTRMYKLFFAGKKNFKNSKLGIDQCLENQLGINFDHILEQYEIPALQSSLDILDFEALNLDVGKNDKFLTFLKVDGDKHAIIKTISPSFSSKLEAVFCHQTYAEYFACVWFKKNKERLPLLKEFFFLAKYDNLRRLFDIMMAEDNPLHLAVIYQNIQGIENNLNEKFEERDEGGRTAFQLACSYGGSCHLLVKNRNFTKIERGTDTYINIIDIFARKCRNFHEIDELFKFDCLDYSLTRGCLYLINKLFAENRLSFDEINELIKRPHNNVDLRYLAIFCAGFGYSELLQELIQQSPALAYARCLNGSVNIFQIAIRGAAHDDYTTARQGNIACVRILIDKIGNINNVFQNTDRALNPLDFACFHRCYDMFEIIMQNRGKCSGGNTILHQFSRWKTFDDNALELVRKFKIDINERNDKEETALHVASLDNIKKLIDVGGNPILVDNNQNSILHKIIEVGKDNLEATQVLLSKGASVNARNFKGQTPFHRALKKGYLPTINCLLEKADLTIESNYKNTALHFLMDSSRGDKIEVTKKLITRGVHVNSRNRSGQTPLHFALKNGFIESAQYLLQHGAELAEDNNQNTVLHYLMLHYLDDKIEMTKIFVKKGVSVNQKNVKGVTALHFALKNGLARSTKFLVENGGNVKIEDEHLNTSLHFLMQSGCDIELQTVTFLILEGVSVNRQNNKGETCLHLAAKRRAIGIFKSLLDYNGDLNIRDSRGNAALQYAMQSSLPNVQLAKFLIEKGLHPDSCNLEGITPTHIACKTGCFKKIELLHSQKADFMLLDNHGNTTLHFASKCGSKNEEIIEFLINLEVNIDALNEKGQTPLHFACESGLLFNVEVLCERNANVTIIDNEGLNVLDYARRNKLSSSRSRVTEGVKIEGYLEKFGLKTEW